jgi:hypothetical protein
MPLEYLWEFDIHDALYVIVEVLELHERLYEMYKIKLVLQYSIELYVL